MTAILKYDSGTHGVFIASTGEWPGTQRLEIVGENGKLVAEDQQLTFYRNRESMTHFSHSTKLTMQGPETWKIAIPLENASRPGHIDILENFADAILDDAPLLAPPAEALAPVELANAMLLSSWRQAPISIPISADAYTAALDERIHAHA